MDNTQLTLTTKAQILDKFKTLGVEVVLHEHQPVTNMKEMTEHVKFQHNTAYVKNLFFVDKKANYYLLLADNNTKVGKQFWKTLGLASGNMRMSKPE